jgi:hypothetical protein
VPDHLSGTDTEDDKFEDDAMQLKDIFDGPSLRGSEKAGPQMDAFDKPSQFDAKGKGKAKEMEGDS